MVVQLEMERSQLAEERAAVLREHAKVDQVHATMVEELVKVEEERGHLQHALLKSQEVTFPPAACTAEVTRGDIPTCSMCC